jgi:hypothetical protein
MKAQLMAASMLAAGALLSGCQSTVPGSPEPNAQNPTEPSFPTPRQTRTTAPTPSSPSPTPTASAAPQPGVALPPQNGYVFIETKSGKTRCQISATNVGCESDFTNAPVVDGAPANGVEVTADGQLRWIVGNLGDIPVVTIDYRNYSAEGWTVAAAEDGTRFTNDSTKHGMFIATEKVEVF